MVAVALHIAAVAVHMLIMVNGILGKGLGAVSHAVGLNVRFCHDIDAILVTQVIPIIVIGIVGCTHRIDIELLHDPDILLHALAGHDIAPVGVQFVPVSALEEHGLAVDQHLRILDLHLPETGLYRNDFGDCTLLQRRHPHRIQIGSLCGPFQGILHIKMGVNRTV